MVSVGVRRGKATGRQSCTSATTDSVGPFMTKERIHIIIVIIVVVVVVGIVVVGLILLVVVVEGYCFVLAFLVRLDRCYFFE